MEPLRVAWLGRVGYQAATRLQESLRRRILDGDRSAEALLLLEHDPVITLGRAADPRHVLAPAARLAELGVEVARASRGGDVTWHGPGQLIAYPVMRLERGVVKHVEALAAGAVRAAAQVGVEARFRRDCPGVWVGGDAQACGDARKLTAFGVHVHRRVAIHGAALNVAPALSSFGLIVPCGLAEVAVTSLATELGRDVQVSEIMGAFVEGFMAAVGREPWRCAAAEIRRCVLEDHP